MPLNPPRSKSHIEKYCLFFSKKPLHPKIKKEWQVNYCKQKPQIIKTQLAPLKKLMTDYEQAIKALIEAKKIVVSTGADISQESGIPTYRDGLTGLWAGHNPQYLETANAFRENSQLVWGW